LWRSAWCAQVTVVPEVSRISVFSSGKCHGLNTSVPSGGQSPPVNSVRIYCSGAAGARLASKKAQNQATKNMTSEAMNRIIP
jgi:hypothetical protein